MSNQRDYQATLSRSDKRIVIVGGPRTGKSTLAESLRPHGYRIFCGDPLSKVKEPRKGVTYLPEDLDWSEGSAYVAEQWFALEGPWVMEGQIMARALRKYSLSDPPADRIFVLPNHHPLAVVTPGQVNMHKAVMGVWLEIQSRYGEIAKTLTMDGHGLVTRSAVPVEVRQPKEEKKRSVGIL